MVTASERDSRAVTFPLAEFAKRVGYSVPTLLPLVRAGHIQCRRLTPRGKRLFTQEDVEAFLESIRQPATPEVGQS